MPAEVSFTPFAAEGRGTTVKEKQSQPLLLWSPSEAPTYDSGLTAASSRVPLVANSPPANLASAGRRVVDLDGDRIAGLIFAGTNAADEVFDWQVIGWKPAPGLSDNNVGLWIPHLLLVGNATLGAMSGIANSIVPTEGTWLFADSITITTDNTESPGNAHKDNADAIAWIQFRVGGYSKLEIQTSLTTAAKANALLWTK